MKHVVWKLPSEMIDFSWMTLIMVNVPSSGGQLNIIYSDDQQTKVDM